VTPTPGSRSEGARVVATDLHRDALVVDLHTHAPRFVPQPFRSVWRATNPRRPPDTEFAALAGAGVNAIVAKAVGDPIVTRFYVRRSPWDAVEDQLRQIEDQAASAGITIATSIGEVTSRSRGQAPMVLLGVEGADALGGDIDRVDAWHARGVRVVVLVHLSDNQLGTTCLPWQQYAGPVPVRRRVAPGLSPFGIEVVRRMNAVGITVDVAHADRATLLDVVDAATAPVVSSHSGARAVDDFARYLSDDEIRAIASTGGVVGLWPYRAIRHGVRDLAALVAHARHVADLVGSSHLAIGTDMNGVPGLMRGYRGEEDLAIITAGLLAGGFAPEETAGILGENAARVLHAVEAAASPR